MKITATIAAFLVGQSAAFIAPTTPLPSVQSSSSTSSLYAKSHDEARTGDKNWSSFELKLSKSPGHSPLHIRYECNEFQMHKKWMYKNTFLTYVRRLWYTIVTVLTVFFSNLPLQNDKECKKLNISERLSVKFLVIAAHTKAQIMHSNKQTD